MTTTFNRLVFLVLSAICLGASARYPGYSVQQLLESSLPRETLESFSPLFERHGRAGPSVLRVIAAHSDLTEHPRIQTLVQAPAPSVVSVKKVELLKRQNSSASDDPSTVAAVTTTVVAVSTTFVVVTSSNPPLSTAASTQASTTAVAPPPPPPPSSSSVVIVPPSTSSPDVSVPITSSPATSAPGMSTLVSIPGMATGSQAISTISLPPVLPSLETTFSSAPASLIDSSQAHVSQVAPSSPNLSTPPVPGTSSQYSMQRSTTAIMAQKSTSNSEIRNSGTASNQKTSRSTANSADHQTTTRAKGGAVTSEVLITTTLPNGQRSVITTFVVVRKTGVASSGVAGNPAASTADASLQSGLSVPRKVGKQAFVFLGGVIGGAVML